MTSMRVPGGVKSIRVGSSAPPSELTQKSLSRVIERVYGIISDTNYGNYKAYGGSRDSIVILNSSL